MQKIIITLSALLCTVAVSAQQDDSAISRQIEVTKQYVPEVEGAHKLYFKPRIGDTVRITPDIEYSIRPTPWRSVFGTQPIAPVNISTAQYMPSRPYYLKAAVGVPFQTMLDFYASANIDPAKGRFGMYVNHKGEWQSKSLSGTDDVIRSWTENRLAAYGGKSFGRRSLDAEIGLDARYYEPRATLLHGCRACSTTYFSTDAKITFGDEFTDFSRFNFRVGAGGAWMNGTGDGNFDARTFADFGWGLKRGVILAGVEFDGWFMNSWNDWYVGITPEYKLSIKKLSLNAGVKLLYNNYNRGELTQDKGGKFHAIPKVKAEYEVFSALIPYVDIDGKIGSGSISALSRLNPFIEFWSATERPVFVDMKGGVRGTAARLLSYDAYAGYLDGTMPAFVADGDWFTPYKTNVGWFYAGGKIGLSLPFGLGLELGGQYNKVSADANIVYYESDNIIQEGEREVGTGIPQFTVGGMVSYNYRDKLFVRLGVEYAGKRLFTDSNRGSVSLPAALNLKAEAEYVIKGRIGIFVTGDNLLGNDIYRYLGYRALGANVMVGVKMSF